MALELTVREGGCFTIELQDRANARYLNLKLKIIFILSYDIKLFYYICLKYIRSNNKYFEIVLLKYI